MFVLGNNTTLDTIEICLDEYFTRDYKRVVQGNLMSNKTSNDSYNQVASFDYQKLKKPLQKFYRIFANDCSQSPGVLFLEISSGQPTFYAKGEHYDVGLIYDILQGLRETVGPGT
ncbi:uncharacterized protein OCT59_029114 [Rhizophagus irregularis]|uniref:uncharacterized protein n=1 Tax=Rhizophagus irregularis TaxID=588596 RepID=UPI00332856DE|nr:hypothetical protein OCT59_029114 [Rhizophagus irregularis]